MAKKIKKEDIIKTYMTYGALISEKIVELLQDELKDEFESEELDLTQFFHAFSTVAPTLLYNELCAGDDKVDNLGFNQIANRLCFQYGNKDK